MATLEEMRARATARQRQAAALSYSQQSPAMREGLADLSSLTRGEMTPAPTQPQPLPDGVNAVPRREDRSLAYRIADNVLGIDDGFMSPGEKLGTAIDTAGESMTLGVVGDEVAGAFDEAIGRGENRTQHYRDNQQQFREENPVAAFIAEMAPAVFVPGQGAAKWVLQGATKARQYGRAALAGAGAAGTYGFAEGEDGLANRAANGLASATAGALFGAAAPKIAAYVTALPKGVQRLWQRTEQRPTIQALKSIKNAAYRAVEESGEAFSPQEMTELSTAVQRIFDEANYVESTDNASKAVLTILERNQGRSMTLPQLDRIRQNMWSRYNGAKDQPRILDAIAAIDELVESRAGSSELMDAARAANSRYAKSQLLDDAFTRAQDQTAATGSGGNILNKYRQAVTSIINNPRKARFFSQDEIDMMRTFVRGDMKENVLRKIGKLSPNGNGLMMALHVVAGVSSSGATLPLMAVGAGAKGLADRSVNRGTERILDVMAGVRPAQVPAAINPRSVAVGVGSTSAAETTQEEIRNMLR